MGLYTVADMVTVRAPSPSRRLTKMIDSEEARQSRGANVHEASCQSDLAWHSTNIRPTQVPHLDSMRQSCIPHALFISRLTIFRTARIHGMSTCTILVRKATA